ncbi:hypothetical protein [Zoogloea sp.]|jgi:uncharacterized Tic20 family protein|uniref:hypothetical protein n=1 Tax=Zoogloea sp. TaxID=49181 RepID=UPI001B6166D0|nr:hypothetical protein [Zoogloea sp.]MBK6654928.1 hypothetical protein [Zoogloea sp.]MBK7846418.1 hypothetical protein [Zoogloea sp.]MBP7445358.1 hypothetical protein [Zoogloea sp.]HOY02510.1 hypothetical protein [Zoogloea sp.]HPI61582.1 hypothetical protein [Zoogloea sp.]
MEDLTTDPEIPGREIAVAAEALYLANLMLIPGLGFVALLVLWWQQRRKAPALARGHLRQTLAASVWAGVLLVLANGLILLAGGYGAASTWVVVILYFTVCHSTLIFCGAIGLARALAGKPFRFPLIGPR